MGSSDLRSERKSGFQLNITHKLCLSHFYTLSLILFVQQSLDIIADFKKTENVKIILSTVKNSRIHILIFQADMDLKYTFIQ